ncbi:MAG: hypothetical protein HEQ23_10365 [Tepidisphaera sp.]
MTRSDRSLATGRVTALILTLFAGAAAAAASQPATTPKPAATRIAAASEANLQARTARAVARVAMLDLRLIDNASEPDYQIADILLTLAQDYAPDDTDLIRRRIEANWNAGRSEVSHDLTKRLIALDPSDTVAQLRFISATIAKRQTASERLALYDKFCASTKLDPSVRSRLAMDAALLAREGGELAKFREWLRLATTLDSTNKEAAMLAVSVFQEEHPGDAPGLIELLSNLLMADPLDPHVHMTLSRELANHGAFEQASRLHANARTLLRKTGGEITSTHEVEALILEWQVDGPAKVCFRIASNLAAQRRSIREYNENVRSSGIGIGKDLGEPEDLRLGADTEKVRLATALAAEGEQYAQMAKDSITDMARSVEFREKMATDDTKRPLGVTREDAMSAAKAALMDLQFWRVIANLEIEKVEPDLVKFADGVVDADLPGPEIVRALLKLRQGDAPAAVTVFDAMMDTLQKGSNIYYTAAYCRGMALEGVGRKDDAIEVYRVVQAGLPLRPVGAMARFRIEKLTGVRDPFSPFRPAVTAIADGIPAWVDAMVEQPKSFMSVLGESQSSAAFGDDSPVIISIRNIAQIPIAVGSDKPINSRFMLAPTLVGRASRLAALVRPEVVEADRVLRLMPRETLRVPVHPDLGYAGLVLDLTCDAQARVKWRLIQGFTPSATGNFVAGPLSLASESPPVTRNPLPEAHLPVEQLIANLGVQSGDELFRSLIAARQKLWAYVVSQDILTAGSVSTDKDKKDKPTTPTTPSPSGTPSTPASPKSSPAESAPTPPAATDPQAGDRVRIVAALAARLPSLPAMQRVLIASMMPHAGQIAEMAPLDAALLADTDPSVQIMALLTRVKKADDPALVAATKSTDPRLSELASLLSTRLATETMCYAKLAPGLAAIRGDIEVAPSEP